MVESRRSVGDCVAATLTRGGEINEIGRFGGVGRPESLENSVRVRGGDEKYVDILSERRRFSVGRAVNVDERFKPVVLGKGGGRSSSCGES